jgi:cytochrome c peroxidase
MRFVLMLVTTLMVSNTHAETPQDFLKRFEQEAGTTASAERGVRFFSQKHGSEWSCSTCHTTKPTISGKHAKTDKVIAPLAPSANPERFTDPAKVDKWFRRNCNDTLDRQCSAQEKADVLAWLLTLK